MITIFHGDNLAESRQSFLDSLAKLPLSQTLHLDSKNLDLNKINNFLQGGSLFSESKGIAIDNLFSVPKANQTKLLALLTKSKIDILLWQDKTLTPAQLKTFPQAIINRFRTNNNIYACINSLKPHGLASFVKHYQKICQQNLFDLFLYLLKASLRKQIQTRSSFPANVLVKTYLQTIELEYQSKTGQLSLSKEIALERVLTPLLK